MRALILLALALPACAHVHRTWTKACLQGDKLTVAYEHDHALCESESQSGTRGFSVDDCLEAYGWRHLTDAEREEPQAVCTGAARSLTLCEGGSAESCFAICKDREASHDNQAAVDFCGRSCLLEYGPACEQLGDLQRSGRSLRAAVHSYDAACRLGMPESCYRLGEWHWTGTNVDLNTEAALKYLRLACSGGGLGKQCRAAGKLVERRDMALLLEFSRAGCDKGDGDSCLAVIAATDSEALADSCDRGSGAACIAIADRKDADGELAAASKFLEKACGFHHGPACIQLADRIGGGRSSAKRAAELLRRACPGNAVDCVQVGLRFLAGKVVPKSVRDAMSAFTLACDARVANACWELVDLAHQQGGTESRKVAEWARSACDLGVEDACAWVHSHR